MKFYSPLRYPGGKNKLAKFIAEICIENNINGHYVEPYAGGASVALHLLFEKYVSEITINDIDRSIFAFWHSVLNNTDEFCNQIEKTKINIKNWDKMREIQKNKKRANLFELGFSTFFLNRTNMSGIINGGVIGGIKQEGAYKIDCRFNKKDLIQRIKKIAEQKEKIHLEHVDAVELIGKIPKNKNTIFYFDPPYYLKGQSLYMNFYEHDDHEAVSRAIAKIKNARWVVSYDDAKQIRDLYPKYNIKNYSVFHTAHLPKVGKEILIFDNKMKIPKISNFVTVQQ
jgi:DNA adenine methylase